MAIFYMKKREKWIIGIFFISLILVLIGVVSAQYGSNYYSRPFFKLTDIIDWSKNNFGPFFAALLGVNEFDEFFFVKVLIFFLIFSVANFAFFYGDIFAGNRSMMGIVSFIIAILSVRYMGDNAFIRTLLIPYTALGATLTVGLPIILYFLFVTVIVRGNYARRILWVIYAVIFYMSYIFATEDPTVSAGGVAYYSWMYIFVAIFIGFNIVRPGWAAYLFENMGIDSAEENIYRQQLARLEDAHAAAMRAGNIPLARQIQHDIRRLVGQRGHFF